MEIFDTYYICRTGKLGQFFTLYIHRTISTDTFHNDVCYFVQNLSHDRDEAIDKAKGMMAHRKAISGSGYGQTMDFSDSKKREYCDLTIFDLAWKKTRKGFIVEMDFLTQDQQESIWETWRIDKDALREAGFSIFKGNDYERQWFFFFKNCSNEEMAEKLAVLKLRKKEKVVTGSFIGELKERIKVEVKLVKTVEKEGYYGTTQIMTMDLEGDTLTSFYSGKKEAPEAGTVMQVTGTVTKHQEFNGINQTIINRIIFNA
ncbi:MAG: hypothetical protein GY799_21045 [Desulfobulbaceae bacterium]|nr:hypothetical protein [Desulfobulbaceae bacterium]